VRASKTPAATLTGPFLQWHSTLAKLWRAAAVLGCAVWHRHEAVGVCDQIEPGLDYGSGFWL